MMSDLEKAYIGLELETHVWNVDIENNGMNSILENGIAGSPEDIYRFIYDNGYNCSESKLQFLLDENDSCPLGETGWSSWVYTDFDGDGCLDNTEDLDDDGDGICDENNDDGNCNISSISYDLCPASSLEFMSGNKVVLEEADTLTVDSDSNNSVDVTLTIMETT